MMRIKNAKLNDAQINGITKKVKTSKLEVLQFGKLQKRENQWILAKIEICFPWDSPNFRVNIFSIFDLQLNNFAVNTNWHEN